MLKISSILIGVTDLAKARPFYEELLGMKFAEFRPPFASAFLGDTEFNIEEDAPYRRPKWAKTYIGGRKHVAFQADDLDAFIAKASAFGATLIQAPETKPWGWREAIIADQDGNEFIIEQKV